MKKALITGISGQDGYFLSQLLLSKGYEVHGVVRRSSHNSMNFYRTRKGLVLHYGDLSDGGSILDIILNVKPDEVYNLGAQSHVGVSFKKPEYTIDITAVGAYRVISAVHKSIDLLKKDIRFYQASSSEMFGEVREVPQTEKTPFHPRSPYACSKVFAHDIVVNHREAYKMHASCGILFNHESEERGEDFVTRKVTKAVAKMLHGRQNILSLGSLDAKRDWGYAKDYVEAMWLMLQQDKPDDYVIATNESHSVREFVTEAFAHIGVWVGWRGTGEQEIGFVEGIDLEKGMVVNAFSPGDIIVNVDPEFYRPSEVNYLIGDYHKAEEKLGWTPKTKFHELVQIMVDADVKREALES